MDPITIAGLTIGLPQLIGWGISIGSIIISNVHTWINERKRKKRDAARLLALQDQVTRTIETKLDAAAKELGQGAEKAAELQKAIQQSNDTLAREQLEKEMQALWKQQKEKEAQINSLMARLESRDQALSEQQEQARQAQEKWLQAVKHMDHVTMPLEQLLGQRRAMRAKLLPLADMQPGCKPDDWHITTIVGPAGKGKSSFVRELLELHNYPNKLCEEVRVSAAGAGTLETMTYMLPKHNVLLLDCVGNAAAGHLARSEVLAADTVLIFMSDDARAEELHGDAFALAWRLRDYMHTVFVQPKADLWLQHNRSDKSPDDAIGALRYAVLAELRSKLSYSATQAQPGLRDRLAECQLSPAPEVAALLHLVDTMSMRAWVRATASDFWISVHCYYCMTNYVTGQPNQVTRNGVRDQAAEQALSVEAQAVRKAAMGALGSGGMPLSLLLRDSRLNSSSQFQEGPVLHANSSEAMALVLRDSVSKYIGQLLFGRSCFYECRLLQLQWWRPANCLRLYVDIRGEADLRPPLGSSIAVIKLRPSHAELVVGAPGSWEWSNVDALGTCLLAHTPDAWEAFVQKPGHFKGVLVWQAAKAKQVLEKLLLFQLADYQGLSCYANREGAAAGRHALVFCYANNLEQTKLSNYTLAPVAIASPLPYRTGRSKEAELAVAWKALPGARTQQQGAFDKELAAEDEVQEKLRWVGLPKAVVARGRGWWV